MLIFYSYIRCVSWIQFRLKVRVRIRVLDQQSVEHRKRERACPMHVSLIHSLNYFLYLSIYVHSYINEFTESRVVERIWGKATLNRTARAERALRLIFSLLCSFVAFGCVDRSEFGARTRSARVSPTSVSLPPPNKISAGILEGSFQQHQHTV